MIKFFIILRPDAFNILDLIDGCEGAVLPAVLNNIQCRVFADVRNGNKLFARACINIDLPIHSVAINQIHGIMKGWIFLEGIMQK